MGLKNKENIQPELHCGPLFCRALIHRPGIYLIRNTKTGKVYVGSGRDLSNRQKTHLYPLRLGRHGNPHLQSAFNLHGKEVFEWVILELCEEGDLKTREQFWIDVLKSADREHGYNIEPLAIRREGCISEETRQRLRQDWHKYHKPPSPELRIRMAEVNRGRKRSPEEIEKSAAARRGKTWKRRIQSDKALIHGKRLGDMTRPESLLRAQRLSFALRGKKHSPEHIQAIRESRLKYQYTWLSPDGQVFVVRFVSEFCSVNNLSPAGVYGVLRSGGQKTTIKGWKFISKSLIQPILAETKDPPSLAGLIPKN